MPFGVYARISKDRTGEERGVGRQVDDCRELIARHPDWTLDDRPWEQGGHVYVDNDISAMSGKRRPAYEAAMAAIAKGEIRGVVVYMQSRIWRNRRERAEGLELFRAARARLEIVKGQSVDMTKAMDRGMVALLGEFDTLEAEIKGERQQAAIVENAEMGAYHGPNRPFGFQIIYTTNKDGQRLRTLMVDDVEAALIREAVRRIIDDPNHSVRRVAVDWNERGYRTTEGNLWLSSPLKFILVHPRNIGIREHQPGWEGGRTTQRGADNVQYKASWPAIVDEDDWRTLREILLDPVRLLHHHGNARRHLLSGFVICGKCGARMVGGPQGGIGKNKKPRYACRPKPEGCGCMSRLSEDVDTVVEKQVFHWLEDNGLYDQACQAVEGDEVKGLRQEKKELLARRDELDDFLADGTWDRLRYERQIARIKTRLKGVDGRLARAVSVTSLRNIPERGTALVEKWETSENDGPPGLEFRRQIIAALVDRVVIHDTITGRNRHKDTASRVQIFPAAWANLLEDPTAASPPPVDPAVALGDQIRLYLADHPDEAFSAPQLAEAIDCHPEWAKQRLKIMLDNGVVTRRRATPIKGRPAGQPPYLYQIATEGVDAGVA
jgi:DNA invertase Pin-like site-specific DNA recombinase